MADPLKRRILVIVPAYNEAANIQRTLAELHTDFPETDVLVVDDASTDGTETLANAAGARTVRHPFNMGYSGALQTGFKYAAARDYLYVVQFDADGQHIAAEARRMALEAAQKGTDIYLGSRFLTPTGYPHPFFRKLGTAFFSRVIHWVSGRKITDPTSGLQVLSRRAFTEFSAMYGYPDYPDANLLLDCIASGYVIEETSAAMRLRTEGVSMHGGIIRPVKYMALTLYAILLIILKPGRIAKQDKSAGRGESA